MKHTCVHVSTLLFCTVELLSAPPSYQVSLVFLKVSASNALQIFNPIKSDVASVTIVIHYQINKSKLLFCTGFIHYFWSIVRWTNLFTE